MTIQDYIRQQPAVIADALAAGAGVGAARDFDPTILVGSGSSFNALTIAAAGSSPGLRRSLRLIGPAGFLREADAANDFAGERVLVLSQSGASTTSVAAAEIAAARGASVLIVTCEADSPIARLPLPAIILPIGGEPIGPKTKGFAATLAGVIAILARAGGAPSLTFASDRFAAHVEASDRAASVLARSLDDLDCFIVAGAGRFFGVALEASLKVAEIAGLPAMGFETEELLHGRLHGVGPRSLVVMIAADAEERAAAVNVAAAMAERKVRTLILNMTDVGTPCDWLRIDAADAPPLDALAAIVPFQWLAVHLALARGMQPEAMRYPGLSAALSIKLKAKS